MAIRFLQIHSLTSYPATLLNRDDAGLAKRIVFGGSSRTRVSSQCLKKHWRSHEGAHSLRGLDVPMSIRSRLTFERLIREPLSETTNDDAALIVTQALMDAVGLKPDKEAQTGQVTILGHKEVAYLRQLATEVLAEDAVGEASIGAADGLTKAEKKQLKAVVDAALKARGKNLKQNLRQLGDSAAGVGLDGALFGRMVTSDVLRARVDAAIHVAHSFTVHGENAEQDYFSAVDELKALDATADAGSGHIDSTELDTGLYYGYVVVDVPTLVANLTGASPSDWLAADRDLASRVIERLVKMIATVSPGAKLGSTAPHAWSQLILVEGGESQPRTLANAFLRPVSQRPDLLASTFEALGKHIADFDAMYGNSGVRACAAMGPVERLTGSCDGLAIQPLDAVAAFAAQQVAGA